MEGGGLGQKAIKLKNSVGSDAFALCFTDILKYNKTQKKTTRVAKKILDSLDKQLERRFSGPKGGVKAPARPVAGGA